MRRFAPLVLLACCVLPAGAATGGGAPPAETGGSASSGGSVARKARAYALFLEARSAMSLGNLEGARERLEAIIDLDPEAAAPRALLSRLCLETGDLDCAETQARAAVARDGEDVDARRVLAQLALRAWRSGHGDAHLADALGHLAAATEARPADTGSWIARIRLLAGVGRTGEAESVAAQAAATPGVDPATPYVALVWLLVAGGHRDQAIGVLSRAKVSGPAAAPLLEMLADLHNARGDLAGQERALSRLYELRPGDFTLSRQLGRTRLELGDPYGALIPLRGALDLRPADPDAALDLARALVDLGRGAEALPLLDSLPHAYQGRPPVLHLWARAAEQAGDHEKAADRLGVLLDRLDDDQKQEFGRSLTFRRARMLLLAGRPADALEALGGLGRGEAPVERLRLRAREALEGRAAADAALARLLGDSAPPPAGLAALAIERRLVTGGADAARRVAAGWIGQADEPAKFAVAVAGWLASWDHPELAADLAAAASAGAGEGPEVARRRAAVYHAAGRLDEAEREYRRALAAGADDVSIFNDLGYLLAERGEDLSEAIRLIQRALAEQPEEPAYLDSLGFALLRSGRVSEALPLLREAARRSADGDVSEIREHLGDAYLALGDLARARAEWQAALAFGGGDRERVMAKLQAHGETDPARAGSDPR